MLSPFGDEPQYSLPPHDNWRVTRTVYCPHCNQSHEQFYGYNSYPGSRCECGMPWEIIDPPLLVWEYRGEIHSHKAQRRPPMCNPFQ